MNDQKNKHLSFTGRNTQLKGICWENGEFSVGYDSSTVRKRKQEILESASWNKVYDKQFMRVESLDEFGDLEFEDGILWRDAANLGLIANCEALSNIGLVIDAIPKKSEISRKRKGLEGCTNFGKKMVKNACFRMLEEFPRKQLGLFTPTLPPLPGVIYSRVKASDWHTLERDLRRRLRTQHKRKSSIPFDLISVCEIQEERFLKYKEVYPHWHFLYIACNDPEPTEWVQDYWIYESGWLRNQWRDAVVNWCKKICRREGLDTNGDWVKDLYFLASIDQQSLKDNFDVASYLSKYLTKGVKMCQAIILAGFQEYLPYQWWYVSGDLKDRVREHTVTLDSKLASTVFYNANLLSTEGYLMYFKYIELDVLGCEYTIGIGGKFTKEFLELARVVNWDAIELSSFVEGLYPWRDL